VTVLEGDMEFEVARWVHRPHDAEELLIPARQTGAWGIGWPRSPRLTLARTAVSRLAQSVRSQPRDSFMCT
jgi:hypothetical protein